jgi:hypothetical protein
MYGKVLMVASLFMCAAALVASAPAGAACAQHGPGPGGPTVGPRLPHSAGAAKPPRPARSLGPFFSPARIMRRVPS